MAFRSFGVNWNREPRGSVVAFDVDNQELFELLGEGIRIRDRIRNGVACRTFVVSTEDLAEDVFSRKLKLVEDAGFRACAPGGEIPVSKCFQLYEHREYSKGALENAEFLSLEMGIQSYAADGVILDPRSCEIEIKPNSIRMRKSCVGALEGTNILIANDDFRSSAEAHDFLGLRFLTARNESRVSSVSSEVVLPKSNLVTFNPDTGNREYDPKLRRIFYIGFPSKLTYSKDLRSYFSSDVMFTEEIVGMKTMHHRRLIVSQKFYRFLRDVNPRDFYFSPVIFE